MEGEASNKEHKSSTSDDEPNSPEQTDDDSVNPNVRYYDCVYCKRGFPTAQALGGHMNIHRKDRGRKKKRDPEPPVVVEKTDYYSGSNYAPYSSYPRYESFNPQPPEPVRNNYRMYNLPMPSSGVAGDYGSRRARDLSLYGDQDLQLGLGTQGEDEEGKGQDEDDGVDLELRLGYYEP